MTPNLPSACHVTWSVGVPQLLESCFPEGVQILPISNMLLISAFSQGCSFPALVGEGGQWLLLSYAYHRSSLENKEARIGGTYQALRMSTPRAS